MWQAMAEAAKPARILETRKTAPGLRLVDKWAVRGLPLPLARVTDQLHTIEKIALQ